MNATVASQFLDEPEIASEDSSPAASSTRQPPAILSLLLLPPVALFAALLPVFYLGIAILIGLGIWEYVQLINLSFPWAPVLARTAIALVPVVPAAILIITLIHPLFSRRPRPADHFRVTREDQPLLVSFVHRVVRSTGAPLPDSISVTCESHLRVARRNESLRLEIGLPLISKLSLQGFGGLLAREFGPFSQALPARLTNFIRSVNALFERMADCPGPMEARIEAAIARNRKQHGESPSWNFRVVVASMRVIQSLAILVRFLVGGFAFAARAVSAPVLRHREFEADAFQTAYAGSENFRSTLRRLAQLEAGFEAAGERLDSLISEGRLTRDHSRLVFALSETLPDDHARRVREKLHDASRWMEFRPSLGERIAHRRDDAGTPSPEKPASSLVPDLATLGEMVTRHWYRSVKKIDPDAFELVSIESLNRDSTGARRQLKAASEFFGQGLCPLRPLFPDRTSLGSFSGLPKIPANSIPSEFANLAERNRELLDRFDELVEARIHAVEFHQLAVSGYSIEPAGSGTGEADPDSLRSITAFLDRQLLQASVKLGPFEERFLRLIAVARANCANSQERLARIDAWFYHLAVVEQIYSVVPELQDSATRLRALVSRQPDSDLSNQREERFASHLEVCELLKRIEDYLGKLPYPFDDYGEGATMWDYLAGDVGTRHEAIAQSAAIADAVIDRIGEFYLRVMGQLAIDLDHRGGRKEN